MCINICISQKGQSKCSVLLSTRLTPLFSSITFIKYQSDRHQTDHRFAAQCRICFIAAALRQYGCSTKEALSIYGIISGMVMPFILFPSSITNAIALMLLPAVATSSSDGDHAKVHRYFSTSNKYSLLLGAACTAFFMILAIFSAIFVFTIRLPENSYACSRYYAHFSICQQRLQALSTGWAKPKILFDHLRKPEHETFLSHCTCSAFRHYGIHLWHNTQSGIYGTALLSYRKAPARIV